MYYCHVVTKDDYCICGGLLKWVWMKDNKTVRTCDRCKQDTLVTLTASNTKQVTHAD